MTSAKILVVDDEPQIRRIMRTTLTAEGYAVYDARSGEEALDAVREQRLTSSCWMSICPEWEASRPAGLFEARRIPRLSC